MKGLQRKLTVAGDAYVVAFRGQTAPQHSRQLRLVVNNQNAFLGIHRLILIVMFFGRELDVTIVVAHSQGDYEFRP